MPVLFTAVSDLALRRASKDISQLQGLKWYSCPVSAALAGIHCAGRSLKAVLTLGGKRPSHAFRHQPDQEHDEDEAANKVKNMTVNLMYYNVPMEVFVAMMTEEKLQKEIQQGFFGSSFWTFAPSFWSDADSNDVFMHSSSLELENIVVPSPDQPDQERSETKLSHLEATRAAPKRARISTGEPQHASPQEVHIGMSVEYRKLVEAGSLILDPERFIFYKRQSPNQRSYIPLFTGQLQAAVSCLYAGLSDYKSLTAVDQLQFCDPAVTSATDELCVLSIKIDAKTWESLLSCSEMSFSASGHKGISHFQLHRALNFSAYPNTFQHLRLSIQHGPVRSLLGELTTELTGHLPWNEETMA
jgi:hypothetical protein